MTIFVVRSTCDHDDKCDEPNHEPLIVMMFAESDTDQKKMVQLIDEAKPCQTQPGVGIVVDSGSETAAIGEALLGIIQRFLIWKKFQKGVREATPPSGVALVVDAEKDNPFSNLSEFDTDHEFGSKG